MNTESYEFMFKVVLVGDMSVGKTNIIAKYLKNQFNEDYKTTIGVEFHSKIAKVEGHVVKAQIWDTCGQERFKSITDSYYKGAKGAFVVYDITRKNTFESVDSWISALRSAADKNLNIIIIGNIKLFSKMGLTEPAFFWQINTIPMLILSIAVFNLFRFWKINKSSIIINYFASTTLGIYLLSDGELRPIIWGYIFNSKAQFSFSPLYSFLYIITTSIIIIGSVVDIFRQIIEKFTILKLLDSLNYCKIEKSFKKLITTLF